MDKGIAVAHHSGGHTPLADIHKVRFTPNIDVRQIEVHLSLLVLEYVPITDSTFFMHIHYILFADLWKSSNI